MIDESAVTVGEAGWRNESYGEVKDGGGMRVFFHTFQKKNEFESLKQKRPIFVERIYITKLVPGDNKLVIDRPMRAEDVEEWPREWARFEQKKTALVSGMPIDSWYEISDTQKAEFRALNIFTVEQFANLPDSVGDKIMGFNDLRAKARKLLDRSVDTQLQEKLAKQDAEVQELRAQVAALSAGAKPKKAKKAKRKLSPEHLAALKAGRERKAQEQTGP